MVIAIDFDGTMVPDCFPGKPTSFLPGAKETILDLLKMGHTVVVWSLRCSYLGLPNSWSGNPGSLMQQFLLENGLEKIATTAPQGRCWPAKFPADIYIDDKVIGGFPGWEKIREHFHLPPLESREDFCRRHCMDEAGWDDEKRKQCFEETSCVDVEKYKNEQNEKS
jgi:hypothetical protein